MQWSPVSKAELPAYLKKAAALLAVATVLGGCSGQPSDSEPTQTAQTALAGEVETTAPTTTTTSTTSELLQLAGEIDVSESDIAVTSSDS